MQYLGFGNNVIVFMYVKYWAWNGKGKVTDLEWFLTPIYKFLQFFIFIYFLGHAKAIVDYTPSPYDRDALRFKKDDIIDIIRDGGERWHRPKAGF